MSGVKHIETDEKWADSTIIEAGNLVFAGYFISNEDQNIVSQINGAFDTIEKRELTLDRVVKMDCLFKDTCELNHLSDVVKEWFRDK